MKRKKSIGFILFLTALTLCGNSRFCSTCGRGSDRFPFTTATKRYCSARCLPKEKKCFNCGNVLIGRYVRVVDLNSNQKYYCLKCSNAQRCENCQLPIPRQHSGSRCPQCTKNRITLRSAAAIMRQVRKDLQKKFGYDTRHRIRLQLLSREEMTKKFSNSTTGYMSYQYKITKTRNKRSRKIKKNFKSTCTIYLLDTLDTKTAGEVLAHELTHDYLFHHLGHPKNNLVSEGICEAVSGAWLLDQGETGRFKAKMKNPHPEYGGGFRLIYPQLKRYGFKKMLEHNRSSFRPINR